MSNNARFVHVNLVAEDWRKLARFYEEALGCTPVPPERDLSGTWIEEATGIPGAHIRGMHLRLPGHGDEGPTLEIFQYNLAADRPETAVNRPGYAHLAFTVDDVSAAREAVMAAGGTPIGQTVSLEVTGVGTVTIVYLADPEGNVVELQSWA